VKSISDLTRAGAFLGAIALAGLLTACGQKGPLYLPAPVPTAATTPPKAPAANTTPPKPAEAAPEHNAAPDIK
jgi:predicted small lipoprotein YifL